MCFKIPRKKIRNYGIVFFVLSVLLSLPSVSLLANEVTGEDRALFWSIQKDGQPAGYLLGTIHSEDPRVLDFSEDFLAKLRENSVFAMELVPDQATLASLAEYMNYRPGTTLKSVVGSERYAALLEVMSVYEIPAYLINRMKPWAALMTISMPPPETGFFMDLSISLRATGNGLQTIGLETLEQQLSFLQDMPINMQLELLDQAIVEFNQVKQVHAGLVDAYLKNDLRELQLLSAEQMTGVSVEAGRYFMQSGIRERNHRMADSLWPYLENQKVFIAVGALHLPGNDGLLNLLRRRGFELNPLKLPFPGNPADPGY